MNTHKKKEKRVFKCEVGCSFRAYPGSEFVVANTLAKWKKLEPNEITSSLVFKSLLARGDFCCLLITFANSLDPDQAQQNVGPDLDPNCLTAKWY